MTEEEQENMTDEQDFFTLELQMEKDFKTKKLMLYQAVWLIRPELNNDRVIWWLDAPVFEEIKRKGFLEKFDAEGGDIAKLDDFIADIFTFIEKKVNKEINGFVDMIDEQQKRIDDLQKQLKRQRKRPKSLFED